MNENEVMKKIMLALGRLPFLRIFRNNTGMAYVGEKTGEFLKDGSRYITLRNPRVFHAGLCEGSSDLIGWRAITITPEMVGQQIAVFTALEVKTEKGRATQEQINFIENVRRAGGIAGVARNSDDAMQIIIDIK